MNAREVLVSIAGNFAGLQAGLIVITAFAGLSLVGISAYEVMTMHSRMRAGQSTASPLYRGLAGAAVLGIGRLVQIHTATMFEGYDARSILDYDQPTGSEAAMLVMVLVGLMTLFGWIGIFKGWLILSRMGKSVSGPRDGDFWNALVFLIAGTVGANIVAFTDVVAATASVENYLHRLL